MESIWVSMPAAFWLGILTAISPCPLATNIAAISYIGRRVERPPQVVASALLYTLGRTLAYVIIAVLLVGGILMTPELARFLQRYINQFIGPILIVAGMFLLDLLRIAASGSRLGERMQPLVERWGMVAALPLGFVFALAFCPVSAALFFGSLIPLAVESQSRLMLPIAYGVGTALPVAALGIVIAFSAAKLGKVFARIAAIEIWARRITGVIFIIVGVYLTLIYVFGIQLR